MRRKEPTGPAGQDRPGQSGRQERLAWRGVGLALFFVATVSAIGCGPRTRPDLVPIALRFIAEDPQTLLVVRDLFHEEHVFVWEFRTPKDLSWWRRALLTKAFPPNEEYAVLTATRRFPRLFRRVQLEADSIHAMRLVTEGLRHEVEMYWTGPAERFSGERRIRAVPRDSRGRKGKTYEFLVASHPPWTGSIREIRLDPTALPKQKFQLHSLTGIKFILVRGRMQAAVERAWKVDLKRDVRNALIVPPGNVIERELEIPREAEFQFAYGFRPGIIIPYAADPITFRVSVGREGEDPTPLFEDTIDPTLKGSTAPGWKEGTIDLEPYEGERVRLIVETTANASWQALHGLPVWANPEVVHRIPRIPYDPDSAEEPDAPEPAPANLILVSLDALRADHLSLYGYDRQTSPHIAAWARRTGVTFQNVNAQAPSTLPSHVSMFTGLEASRHQVSEEPAPASLTMLAELLRQAGYATAAVTGGGPLGPENGLAQGFDWYAYWTSRSDYFEITIGVRNTIEWLDANADRPFFLFLHSLEMSDPYRARAPYAGEFGADFPDEDEKFLKLSPLRRKDADIVPARRKLIWPGGRGQDDDSLSSEQRALLTDLYDSGIAHADAILAPLFARLQELRLEYDTLVILTSDHGESLGEDGRIGHGHLSEENLRVPLVLAFPRKLEGAKVIPNQVRSVDILPTVLDLLDLPPLPGIDGTSLVPLMENDP